MLFSSIFLFFLATVDLGLAAPATRTASTSLAKTTSTHTTARTTARTTSTHTTARTTAKTTSPHTTARTTAKTNSPHTTARTTARTTTTHAGTRTGTRRRRHKTTATTSTKTTLKPNTIKPTTSTKTTSRPTSITTTTKPTTKPTTSTPTTSKPTSTKTTTTPTSIKTTTTPTSIKTTTTPTSTKTSATTSSTSTPTPVLSQGKRGLSFNDPSLTRYFSLSSPVSKVSWAYNWASSPYFGGPWTPQSFHPYLNFVPMLWSAADSLTSIWDANVASAQSLYGSDHLLAFNEPDGCCWSCGNSCMNASYAAAAYQQWIEPYAGKLLLGSPAVTNGVGPGIGIDYLRQFMAACGGLCTVDFVALHWYGSVLDPDGFKSYVESFWTEFGRPVWVTEFGTQGGTDQDTLDFLSEVLPWLDAQTYVQRYAWFMDAEGGNPYLLQGNGSLTSIGAMFNSY